MRQEIEKIDGKMEMEEGGVCVCGGGEEETVPSLSSLLLLHLY